MFKKIFLAVILAAAILPASVFAKDLVKIGSDVAIPAGDVLEHVVVIGGDLALSGTITEDAIVIGGDIEVAPSGRIEGHSVALFGNVEKEEGAFFAKEPVSMPDGNMWITLPLLGGWLIALISFVILLGMFALLILCALFFTSHIGRVSHFTQMHPWKALLAGVITSVLLAPISVMLLVTIVGIPLVPVLIVLVSAATFFGFAAMCQLIGLKFFMIINKPGKPMFIEVLVGFVIIGLITLIPFVGAIVKTMLWFMGLGAVVVTRFGIDRRLY